MKSNDKFKQAATLILIRNLGSGIEVYMTERPGTRDFPGLHVFPGGKVDEHDHQLEHLCERLTDIEASRQLNLEAGGLGYWVTAIRESFEEAGVLLAYSDTPSRTGEEFPLVATSEDQPELRIALRDGEIALGDFLANHALRLATDRLHYFSHWITPASAPRRYDARFFVCDMPELQETSPDASEVASAVWISPAEALSRYKRKEWAMIDPTLRSLEALANYDSSAALYRDIQAGTHLQLPTEELRVQGMQVIPQFVSKMD